MRYIEPQRVYNSTNSCYPFRITRHNYIITSYIIISLESTAHKRPGNVRCSNDNSSWKIKPILLRLYQYCSRSAPRQSKCCANESVSSTPRQRKRCAKESEPLLQHSIQIIPSTFASIGWPPSPGVEFCCSWGKTSVPPISLLWEPKNRSP